MFVSGKARLAADGAGCRGQAHVARLERTDWLAIGALTLLAAAIRFHELGSESLWHDEATTFWRSSQAIPDLVGGVIYDRHTPTYFLLMHAWIGLGDSEFLLRAPSAVFGALTVPLAYALGRLVGGRRVAIVAALLFAISAYQVHYAQEARPYTLLTLCVAVAMLGLAWLVRHPERALQPPRAWRRLDRAAGMAWMGYSLGTLGALATHNMAVFLLLAANAVFGLLALHLRTRWVGLLRNWLLAHAAILAVWIWWWPVLLRQATGVIDHFNYPEPTARLVLGALSQVFVDGGYGILSMSLPFWALLGAWALRRQRWLLATLVALLVASPLAILALSLTEPLFASRQIIWTAIPFFVLAACGIAAIRPTPIFAAALVVILAEGAVKLDRYYETQTKPDWRQLTATLLEAVEPGGLVALSPGGGPGKLVDYYRQRLGAPPGRIELLRVRNDSDGAPIVDALRSHGRMWLVINSRRMPVVVATVERAAVLSELGREGEYRIYRLEPRN